METIIQTQPSLRGLKLSQVMPIFNLIGKQQGLKPSNVSDFRKIKRIALISMANN